MKCSEGLSNRVSSIITRYTDQMKFAVYMVFLLSHSFMFFLQHFLSFCIYGCMFCMLLFNFVDYIFLLLYLCILIVMLKLSYCYVCSVLYILFHCVFLRTVCL